MKLWHCKGPKSGQDEVTNGDKVTGKLDVAEFRIRNRRNLCSMLLRKSQASESSNDAGVFSKASSEIKQERSECLDRCWNCHSQPAFLVRPSEVWVSNIESQRQLSTERHGCSTSFLTSMDKIPAVHLFFLIHGPIGLESMMCKGLSRQRVCMNQLLGHRTLVTLSSSPRQDDQNLNLESSCVGHAETALVSSTCRATAQSFQQETCRHLKHGFV